MTWWSAGGRADADARTVDEHVEAPEALPVASDDAADRVGVGDVGGHGLHLTSAPAQPLGHRFERVGPAGADGQPVALGGEGLGEREPDAAAGSGHDRGAVGHQASVTSNVVDSGAVESPPTQTSKVEASVTQSRTAAFQ